MNRPSPSWVQVSGPLEVYAAGFREELSTLGYSARSAAGHLQLMAHLSRWLVGIGLAAGELTLPQVERFVQGRRDGSRVHRRLTLRGMQPLLQHLWRIGVIPAVAPAAASSGCDAVIEQFTGYLIGERGLAAWTIVDYRAVAGRFLAGCCWESGSLVGVSSELVNSFVLGEVARCSSGSLNTVVTGRRALLRFLHARHYISAPLVDAVPVAPSWRDRGVVRALATDQLARMLQSCDRGTGTGRRDFAILTVLAVIGAHRLRHTAATGMRAAGAPLFEIGQVLRHRHVGSTALYARDDLAALRVVARHWPGGGR